MEKASNCLLTNSGARGTFGDALPAQRWYFCERSRRRRVSGKHQKQDAGPLPPQPASRPPRGPQPPRRIVMGACRLLVNTIIPLASPSLCVYCWIAPLAATLAAAELFPLALLRRRDFAGVRAKTEWATPETFFHVLRSRQTAHTSLHTTELQWVDCRCSSASPAPCCY